MFSLLWNAAESPMKKAPKAIPGSWRADHPVLTPAARAAASVRMSLDALTQSSCVGLDGVGWAGSLALQFVAVPSLTATKVANRNYGNLVAVRSRLRS